MELQDKTVRVSRMIETVIRRCINPKWRYPGGPNLIILQENLKVLAKLWNYDGVADDRVVDYAVYQIYRNRKTLEGGYAWSPRMMFTDFAVEKYRAQFMSEDGKSGMNYYIDQWLDENELSRAQLTAMIADPKPNKMRKYIYMEAEEMTKRRFINTEGGYLLCQSSTTGWSPKSEACGECSYRKRCEEDTERRLPELVRLRREDARD